MEEELDEIMEYLTEFDKQEEIINLLIKDAYYKRMALWWSC